MVDVKLAGKKQVRPSLPMKTLDAGREIIRQHKLVCE